MFLNLSNHPVAKWSPKQLEAAEKLGNHVIDVPFPNVASTATTEDVAEMAKSIVAGLPPSYKIDYAMVQGESTLCWELWRRLIAFGWTVVVACSERQVEEVDGKKVVTFEFIQFRTLRN